MEAAHLHSPYDIKLFSRPLIIGASISAGFGTSNGGPAAVLARLINPASEITNLAKNGCTSLQSTGRLKLNVYNPSIVMGFDLFFWDAIREETGSKFETNARKLFGTFQAKQVPMIVGKIPEMDLPFGQRREAIKRSTARVNELLEELCELHGKALLYDPLECLLGLNPDEHLSDSLHLTDKGNIFCASFLAQSGIYRKLQAA